MISVLAFDTSPREEVTEWEYTGRWVIDEHGCMYIEIRTTVKKEGFYRSTFVHRTVWIQEDDIILGTRYKEIQECTCDGV
jgi:hypothetical protein